MNVVFDLGGVVFSWQPDALVRRVYDDPETQALAREQIIGHPDWIELDRGTLALDDAIVRAAARTGLSIDRVTWLFDAVPPSLTPIQETIELIRSVHQTNSRLYVLSNMGQAAMAYLEKRHDIWDLFDGIVISSRIGMVKPEVGIYRHLLDEHQLVATQTVFIDDLEENLLAAATLGIQTIRFVGAAQCRKDLTQLNYL
jgi:putative hydrolase of the HAD superfamily